MSFGFFVIVVVFAIFIFFRLFHESGPQYGYPSETIWGEEVKSHSERTLADYFGRNGIEYRYEHRIMGIGSADFYLPEYDVVVEFWGLLDADDEYVRNRYVRNMKWKMAQYYSRNIKFISIYPQNLSNLDAIFRSKLRKVTGKELPQ